MPTLYQVSAAYTVTEVGAAYAVTAVGAAYTVTAVVRSSSCCFRAAVRRGGQKFALGLVSDT